MDFHLTKEQLLVRKMYREFAENEVKPLAAEIDEEERFPMETVEKMAKLGMMAFTSPRSTAALAPTCCPMQCAWRSWLRSAAPPLLSFPPTPPCAPPPSLRTAPRSRR